MGCVANIDYDKFPKQSERVGMEVRVYFNYETTKFLKGRIVREDEESPRVRLFQLEDGRFVLDTECQWQPALKKTRDTIKIRSIYRTIDKSHIREIPATLEAVREFVKEFVPHASVDDLKVQPYVLNRRDERTGWDKTYRVCSDAGVLAFTDSPVS